MEGELDYIIAAYSALKLAGAGTFSGPNVGSPLKVISQNHSPSKIRNLSPGKRSSTIIKSSPIEICKICTSAIDLGLAKLNKSNEISNSLIRLVSSSFNQLYMIDMNNLKAQIQKKHQMYIVRLIDLETPSLSFKNSARELVSLFINNYQKVQSKSTELEYIDLLSEEECPMTAKFLILQIIFKKFHHKKYDNQTIGKLLDFFLRSPSYSDLLVGNQRVVLIRLLLSFAKFSPTVQFKQCVNLKFLQLLDEFDLQFESFITNISKDQFIDNTQLELMSIKEFKKVPFFLFDYLMAVESPSFNKVSEHYQQTLETDEQYKEIDWKLVNSDSSSCKILLKLLHLPSVNKDILFNELQNLGKPNAAIINDLGNYIVNNLEKPEPALGQIINYYIQNITQLHKSVISVLDRFVISSQSFIGSPSIILTSFLQLQSIFLRNKQFKRLRNLSNLLYNFALKLTDFKLQDEFITNSLVMESLLFKNDPTSSDLPNKLEKSLKFLHLNTVPTDNALQVVFSDEILDIFQGPTLLHKLDSFQKSFGSPVTFKDLNKFDLSNLSEENRALIFVVTSKYSQDDLHEFFYTLDINEPVLKIFCGIYFQQLPIVKPQSAGNRVKSPSVTGADSLIRSFYYLTLEIKSRITSNLIKIVHLYTQDWISRNKFPISTFEFQFLMKLVDYLKFVNFHKTLHTLLTSTKKYKTLGNSPLNQWLEYQETDNRLSLAEDSQMCLDFINSTISSSQSAGSLTETLINNISYNIFKLQYGLIAGDRKILIETASSMADKIRENRVFFLTDNKFGHPRDKFIEVLTLLIKLHYTRARTLFYLGEHLEALFSFCLAIKVSKSILKQQDEKFEVISLISSSFRYMVKILIHLGISKDAAYYYGELTKFNNSIIKNKIAFSQNSYFLCYYNYVVGDVKACEEIKLKTNKVFETFKLTTSNEYIDNYKLIYYHLISNIYSSSKEDMEQLQLKLKTFLEYMDLHHKKLSINWRLNYEYVFNAPISLKTSLNPYIKAMDLMATSRKLFIDAQSTLNIDPLFSTLEDSAMSIPSAHREGGDILPSSFKKKVKNFHNVKNSIVSLKNSKEICLNLFKDLRYLSNYHIDEIHKVLSLDLLTLSSISNSYHFESIEDSYKLNDYLKTQPLINEKQMIEITKDGSDGLIPNFDFDKLNFTMDGIDQSAVDAELLKKMPEDWLVITIDICSFNGDLIISNFEKGLKNPTFLRLPLSRHSSRSIDEESFSFADAVIELKSIIERSDATTTKERTSSIETSEDRKKWHDERHHLDENMGQLLNKIEYCWIGGFKGIFNQELISDEQLSFFKNKFLAIIRENIPSRSQKNQFNNPVKPVEIDDFVIRLFMKLGDPSKLKNTELLEDLIYFVLDILLFHGEENAYDEIDIDNIYVQVENLINEYIQSNPNPKKNQHTVLVLGKECLLLPWESLPCLRNASTTRMPSLSYLLKLFNENPSLYTNKRNGSFILNPSGDLTKTEDRFKTKFEALSVELNWNGITGEKPTETQYEEALNSDLFVYIGHGGGEQFIRSTTLKSRNSTAPSLLLGCSSASLKDNNLLEPSGTVYSYLIGGCPMIVGNLWDVTDKDIDKFSLSLFEKWGLLKKEGDAHMEDGDEDIKMNICDAVRESRDVCNLKYLNGAAPVVYGLPLSLL